MLRLRQPLERICRLLYTNAWLTLSSIAMTRQRLLLILSLNILGLALFMSWYLPAGHAVWFNIDSAIFYFFNQHLTRSRAFLNLVAITNIRAFDGCSLLAMGLLYLAYFWRGRPQGRRRMIIIGIVMLLITVVLNQVAHLIAHSLPGAHPSPTLVLPNINRITELTNWPTKDASASSFPGDHGMMLLIFACFMWRYFGRKAFLIALAIALVFASPRVMSGAHWFSDIAVGSLSIILVGLSWCLLTPFSDRCIGYLEKRLPGGT